MAAVVRRQGIGRIELKQYKQEYSVCHEVSYERELTACLSS